MPIRRAIELRGAVHSHRLKEEGGSLNKSKTCASNYEGGIRALVFAPTQPESRGPQRLHYLHRQVAELDSKEAGMTFSARHFVHHIDGNTLNNRGANLYVGEKSAESARSQLDTPLPINSTGVPQAGGWGADGGIANCFPRRGDIEIVHRTRPDIADAATALHDKVWYSRAKTVLDQIEAGALAPPNANDLSRVAMELARIEEIHGKENLRPLSPFEGAYLSGKLAALKWVQGCEWDMIDT